MKEWKTYKVGDICSSISETYKSKSKSVVLINTSDVLEGRCLNHEFVPNKDLKGQFKKVFKFGDILYSEIRPANKRFAYIDFDATDYIASTKLMVLRNNDKITNRFLYHYLKSDSTIAELQALAESRSGTFPQITFSELSQLEISIPDIETQSAISNFIDTLESKIELNRQINDNLEQQAQALYKSWFIDFEPFKDGDFVDSELGLIPEGWRVGEFSEICDIIGGGTPSKNRADFYCQNGIAWLTPKDLSVSKAKFTAKGAEDITSEGYNNSSAKLMPRGTVLFSSRAPIGYITIAKNEISTNQGFKSAVPRVAGTGYLYYYLKSNISTIESKASGSTFKEASGALMKSLEVLIPPTKIFNDFEKEIDAIFRKQESLDDEIINLTTLRDTLLPKLMSGELKINEIDC